MGAGPSRQHEVVHEEHHHDDRHHVKLLNPEKMNGMWWVLAKTASECDTICDRETRNYKYNCVSKRFDVIIKHWKGNNVVGSRHVTHSVAEYEDLIMPAKLQSMANDQLPSNGMNGIHTVHYTDYECFTVVTGCGKAWILSRREKIVDTEIPALMAILAKHHIDPDHLGVCCDSVVEESCVKKVVADDCHDVKVVSVEKHVVYKQ